MTKKKSTKRNSRKPAAKPKTKIEVTIKKEILGMAPEEYHFVLADGRRLKSMLELVNALEDISEDLFRHHVNEARNDFASWVKDVFNEENLAEEIRKSKNRVETQLKILKHIVKKIDKKIR